MYIYIVFLTSGQYNLVADRYRKGDIISGIFITETIAKEYISGHIWEDYLYIIAWKVLDTTW